MLDRLAFIVSVSSCLEEVDFPAEELEDFLVPKPRCQKEGIFSLRILHPQ
jgi:hypothetical protein